MRECRSLLPLFSHAAAGFAVLAAAACHASDTVAPVAEPPITLAQLCARKDSLLASTAERDPNIENEFIARLVPGGYGGIGLSFLWLKQPELADTMRATVRALATCPGESLYYLNIVPNKPVWKGDFDWIELRHWYNVVNQSVDITGMTIADIDESINRLTYGFDTESHLLQFRGRARDAGVPLAMLNLVIGYTTPADRAGRGPPP